MFDTILEELFSLSEQVYHTFSYFWRFCTYDFKTLKLTLTELGFDAPVKDGGAIMGDFIMDAFVTPLADIMPDTSIISFVITLSIFTVCCLGIWRFIKDVIF